MCAQDLSGDMFSQALGNDETITTVADPIEMSSFERSPFNDILVRPDRSVRLNTGTNSPHFTVGSGVIVFTAEILIGIGEKIRECSVDHSKAFASFADEVETGQKYFRCRYGQNGASMNCTLDESFAVNHPKFENARAGYTFIKADSPFLRITPQSEFILTDNRGDKRKCLGIPATWTIGTPNDVRGLKEAQLKHHPELRGINTLINSELPANPEEARAQFAGDLIPADAWCQVFAITDTEDTFTVQGSRLFVDDTERLYHI